MKTTPFERLIQQEIGRIKTLVLSDTAPLVSYQRYPSQFNRYTLILKRLKRTRPFSGYRLLTFMSFF